MKRTLTIPVKSFSINTMFCKNRAFTTSDYKTWAYSIFHRLDTEDNLQAFEDLRTAFDVKKHAYSVSIITYFPFETLYTKKGILSSRAFDLSNIEKPLIDLIFLPKYFDQPSPYGIANLNIDDKYIIDLSSKKRAAPEHRIDIEIEVVNNLFSIYS